MLTATQSATATAASTAEEAPPSILEVLRTFVKVQETRRAHWAEYHDAIAAHAKAQRSSSDEADEASSAATPTHRAGGCACQASSGTSKTASMTDADLARVLALVTAGLIDAAHSARTCAVALSTASSATSDAALAKLINEIQDAENELLRSTVELERKRREESERDQTDVIGELEGKVKSARERIMEGMEEVGAEIAERSQE